MANVRTKSLVGVAKMTHLTPKGLSMIGMLLLLIVIALAISFGLKIGPHYMNFRTIQTLLTGLSEEEVKNSSRPQVMALLKKRFKVNSLYDTSPEEVIKYKRERGATILTIDYEVREHLFGNVYVLLDFDESRTF